jgi:16S rRNA processing protein RimM
MLLVRFQGVESRDDAAELRGVTITIGAEEVPEPPDGSYYYFQLLGCRCQDVEAGSLGVVTDVLEDGGGLLLSLDLDGRKLLVPFVSEYIRRIDLEGQTIDLDLPQGLLDLCVSPS